jgi:uncharacterized membrane protein YbhN (UPF0104 family)
MSEQSLRRILKYVNILVAPVLIIAAGWVLFRLLGEHKFSDVIAAIENTDRSRFIGACFFVATNYLVLTLYDTLAFRYIRRNTAYRRIGIAAFCSYTFSHNLGFSLLSGGAVRYRLYSRWGLSASEIAKVIVFSGGHFWLGLSIIGAAVFFIVPEPAGYSVGISAKMAPLAGLIISLPSVIYMLATIFYRKTLTLKGVEIEMPRPKLAALSLAVACVDWLLAASVLVLLLPARAGLGFAEITVGFALSQFAGVASNVPGGIGVLEAVLVYTLHKYIDSDVAFGACLLFRIIYYIIPFLLGFLALTFLEISGHRKKPSES